MNRALASRTAYFVVCCVFLTPLFSFSQKNLSSLIEQKAMTVQSKLVEWRRHLHQHPELSNREYKTGEFNGTKASALFFYLGGMPNNICCEMWAWFK